MKITKEEKDKLLQIIDTLQKENAQLKKQNELLQYEEPVSKQTIKRG
jgi:cell division protein FtsB